jgi:hypothetical protein
MGLPYKQVDMLGHQHISGDYKFVALTNRFEFVLEDLIGPWLG